MEIVIFILVFILLIISHRIAYRLGEENQRVNDIFAELDMDINKRDMT